MRGARGVFGDQRRTSGGASRGTVRGMPKPRKGPAKEDPRRAVAYLRVSTEEQHLGPEAQRTAIEGWAAREGVEIVAWKTEQGVSGGAELADRPVLTEAIASLHEHNAGVLVVAKRDRLARDVTKAREIAALVQVAGAAVRSADGASDLAGPEGVLMQTIVDTFAEYERLLIRARTKAALDRKRARGEAVGKPPYGFRVGPGTKLIEDPGEQAVIREIVRLKRADATERAIVEELAKAGFLSRAGKPLSQTQVHRIVARMPSSERTGLPLIRRSVEPFKDVQLDVDLEWIVEQFNTSTSRSTLEQLARWLDIGAMKMRVVSLTHYLAPGWLDRVKPLMLEASGKQDHQHLCAIAALFLREACGKEIIIRNGNSSTLSYSGGVADVAAADGSLYVECGTLREDKINHAMRAGERVLVVPYLDLEQVLPPAVVDRLVDDGSSLHDSVVLGFQFSPTPQGKEEFSRIDRQESEQVIETVKALEKWGG